MATSIVTGASTASPLDYAVSVMQAHTPYVWGGTSPAGFDCSGFVQWIFAQSGVQIGRTTGAQYGQGQVVPLGPPGNRLINAQPGDVVFFGMDNASPSSQHEGIIYSTAGAGTMINAPHTGAFVGFGTIGEGDSAEPISGIRRFSPGDNTTLPVDPTTGLPTATLTSSNSSGIPLVSKGELRGFLAGLLMLSGVAVSAVGIMLLVGKNAGPTIGKIVEVAAIA